MTKVESKDGKYKLGGSKDTDLEGIDDKKYNVFTEEDKLANAKRDYPTYTWFISYTIKDKDGKDVRNLPEYTIKLDKPDSEKFELYYYLDGTAHPLRFEDTDNQGSKKRVKAKLDIGDPPTGSFP
ncbi:MAG: hypothetical protein ACXW4Q_05275 [Anaerolineales bacterium]